ncbi:hypothetical protein ACQBAT_02500 [Ornithinimicrobium sp. Y1847]|uniref:hypothetical protein n=1 Tax=Ornithinimicrobium sp. Y1847 TaxID=3405419 RepID=UPI003B67A1D2
MFGSSERIERLERRVKQQEQVIAELCRKAGLDPASVGVAPVGQVDAEEQRLIAAGKTIQAIKHYRERTGAGLREAKEFIEAAARRHGQGHSGTF